MADMAEPGINLSNPTEVARETLRRLALRRIAPTPDNYQALFDEIVGTSGEASDSASALLREMLVKALEYGVVSQLGHNPRLSEKALQIAASVREANSTATLQEAASALKSLWMAIELQAGDSHDQQELLRRILLLLVENISELLDDDTWLHGQLDVVQEVISGPLKIQSLQASEKRLKEVIYKQSMVKHGLREATARLKETMTTFVSRLSNALAANDDYQAKITAHVLRIQQTDDVLELNRILENLIQDTRTAQAENRRAHDQLVIERDSAVHAEARIHELEAQLGQMSALIREDPLTRSLNRRGMDAEFAREAARADRYRSPFCLAVIDIDNFKALNDLRGHHTGDDALVHLVAVAREELRLTDHIARLGGEEFLIMLPNTPLDGAVKLITRVQRSLTRKFFMDKNEQVLITFSAGVAERLPGEPQDASIARADAAMYVAKHTGKNRVCTAPNLTDGNQT
jgi:diguanylate cyclase